MTNRPRAGIGFRVKTGYAAAITLIGAPDAPELFGREDVLLADLDVDDSRQPYHAALERGERAGAAVVKKARRDAQGRATTALQALLQAAQRGGSDAPSVGLVVGSTVDPASLGNLHIRAHDGPGACGVQVSHHGDGNATAGAAHDLVMVAGQHLEGAGANSADAEQADLDGFHADLLGCQGGDQRLWRRR